MSYLLTFVTRQEQREKHNRNDCATGCFAYDVIVTYISLNLLAALQAKPRSFKVLAEQIILLNPKIKTSTVAPHHSIFFVTINL